MGPGAGYLLSESLRFDVPTNAETPTAEIWEALVRGSMG